MKKSSLLFDDQHQPMSSWMDKLASDESSTLSDADLAGEQVSERKTKKYAGVSSTWDKKRSVNAAILNDSTRRVSNKHVEAASIEHVEKEAKALLMSGLTIEKVSSVLKKRFSSDELKQYATVVVPKLEQAYGRLGSSYLDAELVSSCDDMSEIMKTSNRVASIAVRDVKKSAKCEDCNFNKQAQCLKLGLNIVDEPQIRTAKEAKFILNKFASLKYVNSYFVKAADLTSYYDRLASESPDKVIQDFLIDVNTRRSSKQTTSMRLKAEESIAKKIANKPKQIKTGADDIEVSNAFKQFLVTNQSLRTAKAELAKKYGKARVDEHFKSARTELRKFVKFIVAKTDKSVDRIASSEQAHAPLINKVSSAQIANAMKMAKTLITFRTAASNVKSNLNRTFGPKVAEYVFSRIASDGETGLLGLTYIDAGLYKTANEMKEVLSVSNRRAGNMIAFVKEGTACKLADNHDGKCPVTGLQIVKSGSVDTKRQALRILNHARKVGFSSAHEIEKVESKLASKGNYKLIRAFLANGMTVKKALSDGLVKQVTDVALKYAKNVADVRKVARVSWKSTELLIDSLTNKVANKKAFVQELKGVLDKSASDANVYLNQLNQYNTEIFSSEKERTSDAILGQTF